MRTEVETANVVTTIALSSTYANNRCMVAATLNTDLGSSNELGLTKGLVELFGTRGEEQLLYLTLFYIW